MNSARLDSLLATTLSYAEKSTTFRERVGWMMLARGIAAQADHVDYLDARYSVWLTVAEKAVELADGFVKSRRNNRATAQQSVN